MYFSYSKTKIDLVRTPSDVLDVTTCIQPKTEEEPEIENE